MIYGKVPLNLYIDPYKIWRPLMEKFEGSRGIFFSHFVEPPDLHKPAQSECQNS